MILVDKRTKFTIIAERNIYPMSENAIPQLCLIWHHKRAISQQGAIWPRYGLYLWGV